MPTTHVNGIELYYETAGSAHAPPLLLIEGLTGYTKGWALQVPAFEDDFFVITFDNRGAGQSTQPAPGYTIAEMADDTAALLDALQIPSAFVFGISMGGTIALNLAARHPQKVKKLALGCTWAGMTVWNMPDEEVLAAMTAPSSGDLRQDFYNDLWYLVGPDAPSQCPERIETIASVAAENPQSETGFMGQFQACMSHDVTAALADFEMPVLVMHGDADVLIPFANGQYLAEHIPGAEFEIYHNAGHLIHVERTAAVNQRLRDFFLS
jgi:pimeloyl-ACP methyl ester carboxylesterase